MHQRFCSCSVSPASSAMGGTLRMAALHCKMCICGMLKLTAALLAQVSRGDRRLTYNSVGYQVCMRDNVLQNSTPPG